MPLLAVGAAAIGLAAGGATAIGAVIGGSLALTDVFAATAAVGGVLGAVGAVTGDKTLSTIGMVIGGVGGVGALANAAGAFGAGATVDSIFGSSGDIAPVTSTPMNSLAQSQIIDAGVDSTPMNAGMQGLINQSGGAYTGMSEVPISSSSLPDVIDSLSGQQTSSYGTEEMSQNGTMPSASQDSLSAVVPQQSAPSSASSPATATAALPDDDIAPVTSTPAKVIPGAPSAISTADQNWYKLQYPNGAPEGTSLKNTATGNSFTITGGVLTPATQGSGIMDFLKTAGGGTLGMGVLQAGGAFLQGAFNPLTPAQVAAYNAQAAANNASAAVTQQQAANMNAPIPVAHRVASAPVTGAPAQSPGIINQPMAGAA